jgi:meiotically up-regulated gene 157 (Mug157) protein
MWLRDSTWQLRPMLAACDGSGEVEEIIAAVSRRQSAYVLIDPYANAFNVAANGNGWHKDFDDQSPWVFERRIELDSLAAFFDLALRLQRVTGYQNTSTNSFGKPRS